MKIRFNTILLLLIHVANGIRSRNLKNNACFNQKYQEVVDFLNVYKLSEFPGHKINNFAASHILMN